MARGRAMRESAKAAGWFLLVAGGILIALGILTWPPGGLLFALPYLFLIPAVPTAAAGGLLLWLGSRNPTPEPGGPDDGVEERQETTPRAPGVTEPRLDV